MASYTEPDLNDFLPGEPFTSAKALLAVENPLALFEGAAGAPRIAVSTAVGNGTTDFSLSVPDGYTGAIIELKGTADGDDTTKNIRFAVSDNNGSSYASDETIGVGSAPAVNFNPDFKMFIDFASGAYRYILSNTQEVPLITSASGTVALPAGTVDRIIFRVGGSDELLSAAVFAHMNGGTAAS